MWASIVVLPSPMLTNMPYCTFNFREELQKKDEQLIAAGKGGGALGIERISQLETQLASASTTCLQLHENVSELEKQNTSLQEELHRLSVVKYVYILHNIVIVS